MGGWIMNSEPKRAYRPTGSKYKGRATVMYVAYDLEQRTRGGSRAVIPKIKRVYIAGDVAGWEVGDFRKRTGREVHGVRIDYEQTRRPFRRDGFLAARGPRRYRVPPVHVRAATQRFSQVVELPAGAQNVTFYARVNELPQVYRHALQRVR
jgi:hypothetical protein